MDWDFFWIKTIQQRTERRVATQGQSWVWVKGWRGQRGGGTPDFSVNSFLFPYNTQLPANDESPEAKWAGMHGADCAQHRLSSHQASAAAPANCFHSDTDFVRAMRYSLS